MTEAYMLLRAAERFGLDPWKTLFGLDAEQRIVLLDFERLRQAEEVRKFEMAQRAQQAALELLDSGG